MKLVLHRTVKSARSTEGFLEVDGRFQSYTLEPTYREKPGIPVSVWKVMGKTAIPVGTYSVDVTFFNKPKYYSPVLIDVPGFAGIRIHIGNFPKDTDGCILVGTKLGTDKVVNSKIAFDALMQHFDAARGNNEGVQITVMDDWGAAPNLAAAAPQQLVAAAAANSKASRTATVT
ncbi:MULTISPECIES: DUF5675 family protein [unclassified Caballeronia]|uniref:DUF5675 family protein n=1 Tax=unclassified Caballeronia TaxID=2646786 RepID=UPI00285A92FB|nr:MULTISPECIES: DUF5675 family protein [unclassified Caballeronia]MDR5750334.1 DUF5675 family protein [Caballeronia sp. LZ024]MDR5842634.1 DUF5675 family protein [Caballeronia sp. LZ031]